MTIMQITCITNFGKSLNKFLRHAGDSLTKTCTQRTRDFAEQGSHVFVYL